MQSSAVDGLCNMSGTVRSATKQHAPCFHAPCELVCGVSDSSGCYQQKYIAEEDFVLFALLRRGGTRRGAALSTALATLEARSRSGSSRSAMTLRDQPACVSAHERNGSLSCSSGPQSWPAQECMFHSSMLHVKWCLTCRQLRPPVRGERNSPPVRALT